MHYTVHKRFFELITSKTALYAKEGNPINTYKELIHYRFKEVVISSFPRFLSLLDEEEIDTLIVEFIKSKPKTPYVWKMPNEFRQFLSTQSLAQTFPFMDDLLWFEWIEIELSMKNYKKNTPEPFSWDNGYILSNSSLIKQLNFPVYYEKDYEIAGAYPLLMFYNFVSNDVHYQEITPFMEEFISLMKKKTANEAIIEISSIYDVDVLEVKELLQETLETFLNAQILKENNKDV